MQNIINNSGLIEDRGIAHSSTVCREDFIRQFKTTPSRGRGIRHQPWINKLPKAWSRIMAKRTWHAITEVAYRISAAARSWLNEWCSTARGIATLDAALFSRLSWVGAVLVNEVTGDVVASLGNHSWAMLGWPLIVVSQDAQGFRTLRFNENGKIQWIHIIDPYYFSVIPWETYRHQEHGLILEQVGEPITLIRGALENISTALDHSDLVRIAARLNLANVGSLDLRETLLMEIAMCISNGDGEFAESVVEAKSEEQSENLLAQDPIVAKVFEEADDEDKKEFDDMGKAMTRQKNKQRQAKVNADRKNTFRAKAKAKAKAKAAAAGPAGAAAAEPHPVPKATLPVQPAGI